MMKRLTKADWDALGVHNSHNLCVKSGRGLYVSYDPQEHGRTARYARWKVIRPGYRTDPQGHFRDNYNKTFTVAGRDQKEPMRLEAIAWAANRYGIAGEWERDPWGSYHPPGALKAAQEAAMASQVVTA